MKTKLFFALILVVFLVAPLWAKGPNGPSTSSGLDETEKANILYLFEEEKWAHDIYVEMYNRQAELFVGPLPFSFLMQCIDNLGWICALGMAVAFFGVGLIQILMDGTPGMCEHTKPRHLTPYAAVLSFIGKRVATTPYFGKIFKIR